MVDEIEFLHPVAVGQVLVLRASLNFASKRSMEVGVKVWAENPRDGSRLHTSSAYLTFVAVDAKGRPVEVPPVLPETKEEKRRYAEAEERRARRLKNREAKRARKMGTDAATGGSR